MGICINQHRLDVHVDSDGATLLVMGGLVRVDPPYTQETCSSSNELVLQKVCKLMASLDVEDAP